MARRKTYYQAAATANVRLRSEPSPEAEYKVGGIPKGTAVLARDVDEEWAEIKKRGYVRKKYIKAL